MVLVTVSIDTPHLGTSPRGIAVAVALGVTAIAWIFWLGAGHSTAVYVTALAVMAAAGGALAGMSRRSPTRASMRRGSRSASASGSTPTD